MIQLYQRSLTAQYHAALSTLTDCIARCPDQAWSRKVGNFPFWHVAYHALYYADLYLSPNEASFTPRDFHRENIEFLGPHPRAPEKTVTDRQPYTRETLLDYSQHCRQKVSEILPTETAESLAGPCGFWWYEITRAEFHVNNVRHIQHHAAQMSLFLRYTEGVEIAWVKTGGEELQD